MTQPHLARAVGSDISPLAKTIHLLISKNPPWHPGAPSQCSGQLGLNELTVTKEIPCTQPAGQMIAALTDTERRHCESVLNLDIGPLDREPVE